MNTADQKILNNYLGLLERLNTKMKLDIIDRLKKSIKSQISTEKMKSSFGSWKSDESPEELIDTLRSNRNFNRNIEEL
ncbi:MAG: hypothetical protein ABJN36_09695 [Cyclobacteriaceae bacterium]